MTDRITIFDTDHRLRNLINTNATVHNAYRLALRDGDDMDALIMAVLVLVNQNESLFEALNQYVAATSPTIRVEARAVAEFFAEQANPTFADSTLKAQAALDKLERKADQ